MRTLSRLDRWIDAACEQGMNERVFFSLSIGISFVWLWQEGLGLGWSLVFAPVVALPAALILGVAVLLLGLAVMVPVMILMCVWTVLVSVWVALASGLQARPATPPFPRRPLP